MNTQKRILTHWTLRLLVLFISCPGRVAWSMAPTESIWSIVPTPIRQLFGSNHEESNRGQLDKDGKTPLMHAIDNHNMRRIEWFLKNSADLEVRDNSGKTALMHAFEKKHISVINQLLRSGASPVGNKQQFENFLAYVLNNSRAKKPNGPLFLPCAAEHDEYTVHTIQDYIALALCADVNVNARDEDNETFLIKAAKKGFDSIVEQLLAAKAHLHAQDSSGKTALMHAFEKKRIRVINQLLRSDASPVDTKQFENLIAYVIDNSRPFLNFPFISFLPYTGDGIYDFHRIEDIQQNIALALHAGADVNAQDKNNETFLIKAAKKGFDSIVEQLLAAKAHPHAQDKHGKTALMHAAERGHSGVMLELYFSTPSFISFRENFYIKDERGKTALMYAAEHGHTDALKSLLKYVSDTSSRKNQEYFTNVFLGDQNGKTALMYAAENGHTDALKTLLEYDAARPRATLQKHLNDALLCAATSNHFRAVESISPLIQAGANPNAQDEHGKTAIAHATENGHPDVLIRLLKNGTALSGIHTEHLNAALLYAVAVYPFNTEEYVKFLITAGANPKARTEDGKTPLMIAAGKNKMVVALHNAIVAQSHADNANLEAQGSD